jgi:molecular chaperone GrpE (heat shock protein)
MDQDNKYFSMESEIQKLKTEVEDWKTAYYEKCEEIKEVKSNLYKEQGEKFKYKTAFTTLFEEVTKK